MQNLSLQRILPKRLRPKLYRYISVSGVNLPLTQIFLWITNSVLGLRPIFANITAVSIAAIPAYYLYRNWVWSGTGRSHFRKEVLPFWITAIIGLGVSTLTVWLVTLWWESFWTVALGNIVGFGIVWLGRFAIYEVYLFRHHTQQPDAPNTTTKPPTNGSPQQTKWPDGRRSQKI